VFVIEHQTSFQALWDEG